MPNNIDDYISKRRSKGDSDSDISKDLISAGWSSEQAEIALGQKDELPPPPPNMSFSDEGGHVDESMWSGFQNILTFISLGSLAGALHIIWSLYVETVFPKTDGGFSFLSEYILDGTMSTVVVSAPFFAVLFYLTNMKFVNNPELKRRKGKKVLNYITLVITFLILLGRLIGAVNSALSGNFSVNFAMQLLVTFLIVGSIFIYYTYEVKIEKKPAGKRTYGLASILVMVIAGISLVVGLNIKNQADEINKQREAQMEARYRQEYPISNPTPKPSATPPSRIYVSLYVFELSESEPESVIYDGIEYTLNSAQVYRTKDDHRIVELDITGEAVGPCPEDLVNTDDNTCVIVNGAFGLSIGVNKYETFNTGESSIFSYGKLEVGQKATGRVFLMLDDYGYNSVINGQLVELLFRDPQKNESSDRMRINFKNAE